MHTHVWYTINKMQNYLINSPNMELFSPFPHTLLVGCKITSLVPPTLKNELSSTMYNKEKKNKMC